MATLLGSYISTFAEDSGSAYYPTLAAHYTGFGQMLGQTPSIVGAVIASNAAANFTPCDPSQWPAVAQDQVSQIPAVIPKTTALMMSWTWQDNTGKTIYPEMSTGNTFLYAGVSIDSWIQQSLDVWRLAGWNKLYLRPTWEWNIDLTGNHITNATVSTFIAAWRHFYTVVHNYSTSHAGMDIRVCWNPAVFGQSIPQINTLTLAQQFPNQVVGDHFVDVICADFYAEGASFANDLNADPAAWTITRLVDMCKQWNLPLGFCELGGISFTSIATGPPVAIESAAKRFIPSLFTYLNSLGSTVAIEFLTLWDVNVTLDPTVNLEFTAPQAGHADIVAAWRAGFASLGVTTPVAPANRLSTISGIY